MSRRRSLHDFHATWKGVVPVASTSLTFRSFSVFQALETTGRRDVRRNPPDIGSSNNLFSLSFFWTDVQLRVRREGSIIVGVHSFGAVVKFSNGWNR